MNALQRYANAAFQDGLDIHTIKTLASLASWGRNSQNTERDFHRAIPFLYDCALKTHSICVETWDSDAGTIVPLEVPILLASDVLHQLWAKNNPKLWRAVIGATAETCSTFWSSFSRDPACTWDHPVFRSIGSKWQ